MSLYSVQLTTKVITETEEGFSVDGFMNPTFHNDGEASVRINDQVIHPNEHYAINFPNCVLSGKVNIKFNEGEGRKLVIIKYGMVVGLATDPQSGAIYSQSQIASSSASCNT